MPSEKRQRQKQREQEARAARAAAQAAAKRRRNMILAIVAVVAVFGFAFIYSVVRGGDGTDSPGTSPEETVDDEASVTTTTFPIADEVDPECPPEDGSAERTTRFTEAPPFCLDEDASYEAVFETDAGDIVVELDTDTTPNTVNNFVFLSRWGYYDGTALFRTDTSIDIIQGGGPHTQTNFDPGPGYTIQDEGEGFNYQTGDLIMARSAEGAGAQFFFGAGPNVDNLSPGPYVTFGRVTEGLEVLEEILARHTGPDPGNGAPDPLPIIETVRIVQS